MLQMLMDGICRAGRHFFDARRQESDVGKSFRRCATRGYRAALAAVCRLLLVAVTLNPFMVHAQTIGASAFIGTWQTQFNDGPYIWNGTLTVSSDFTWSVFSSTPASATLPAISCNLSGTYVVSAVEAIFTVTSSTTSPAGIGTPCDPVGKITTIPFSAISGSGGVGSTFVNPGSAVGTWTKIAAPGNPSTSTTTAIVLSGLWNAVQYDSYCNNYVELSTINFTYANGLYSYTDYTSNGLDKRNCQNVGPTSKVCTGFFASAQDLLTTSQIPSMFSAMSSCSGGGSLQSVSLTSPDSISLTAIDST